MSAMMWVVAIPLVSLIGCLTGPAATDPGTEIADARLRALFIGNSLTRFNDLPGQVEAFARAGGHSFAQGTAAAPNFSLEDHVNAGVEELIRETARKS